MSELCNSVRAEFSAESAIQHRIWGPPQNFLNCEIEQKMLCIFLIFSSFYGVEWVCLSYTIMRCPLSVCLVKIASLTPMAGSSSIMHTVVTQASPHPLGVGHKSRENDKVVVARSNSGVGMR